MKIRLSNISLAIIALVMLSSCGQGTNAKKAETLTAPQEAISANELDPIFTDNPATGDFLTKYFTGDVSVNMMLGNDENNEYSIANVVFDPSARTNWHTHPKGQVLLVLAGNGYYKEEGKPVRKLSKGDVVNIPPHVNHWHGAQANSEFVHIAITNYKDGKNVSWGDPVTDEEYTSVVE